MPTYWYGYHFYAGGVKRHSGITTDPQRRQEEHRQRWPGGSLMIAIGPTNEANARNWEALQTRTITPQRR
jgi:hypothetical protein